MKTVNGLPVYEGTDTAALDEYSEKMAEKVPKIIEENSYDDTAIKKEIQELDDNQIHVTTERVSNINVQDCSGQNAKIKLFGISRQKTRSGYNLLNVPEVLEISIFKEIEVNLKANNTYTFKFNNAIAGSDNNVSMITFRNTTDVITKNLNTSTTKKIEVQPTQDITNVRIYASTDYSSSVGKTKTFQKLMIYKGIEDKDYEQYGASPSPEYPSNIENVTGDIDITVCNKNLFDKNKITDNNYLNENGGLTANTLYCVSDFINVAENETYFLKTRGTSRTKFYDKNKQPLTNIWDVPDGDKKFVIPSNAKYIRFSINKETVNVDTFQFERNSIATDYIENEQQTITFPLAENQKMMEGSETKDDEIHHKRKQIVLDGTENWILSGLTTNNQYILTVPDIKIIGENNKGNLISSHFKEITGVEGYNNNNINGISGWSSTQIRISLDISIINRNVAEFKNWLAQQKTNGTPVIVEYELAEEEIETYTEEQQTAYDQLQNAKTYKTVTNVFTENAEVEMEYVAHTKTYIDNEINSVKEELNTIKELLSTTTTSAMLLDNMQTDLESEVL